MATQEIGVVSYEIPGKVRVELEYIGEGLDGDYQPGDKGDYRHLRFDVIDLTKHPLDASDGTMCGPGHCRSSQDASYCTAMSDGLPEDVRRSVCKHIAEAVVDAPHWKRLLEQLSWLDDDDAKKIHGGR